MKDIDFDELDKAVSSLMGGVSSKTDQNAAKTLTISETLKEDEQPEYSNIRQAAEKIGSETIDATAERTEILPEITDNEVKTLTLVNPVSDAPTPGLVDQTPSSVAAPPATAAPKAQSGRFMDVMHPSSDMKTASVAARVQNNAAKPSREAAKIERPQSAPVSAVEPEPVQDSTPVIIDAPAEPATTPIESDISIAASLSETSQILDDDKIIPPQTSPFLPGAQAKVEKRPLGGAPSEAEETETVAPVRETSEDLSSFEQPYRQDNSADTQLAPNTSSVDLPEELHTDLLAIETNLAESTNASEEVQLAEQPSETSATPTVAVAASQDTTTAPSDGAIFDTTEYHKPVAHPTKHGSEWIWIAVIVVIIVICAAGAAAFYLLGTK